MKAAEKYLPLITNFETDIPERVIGDPYRFRQVLMNLLSNAIKFTEKGHIKISLAYDDIKEVLHCSVEDTGIGIKSENRARIFEAFLQEDMTITRRYGGTGLGLAICNRLMEMMGSKIELESNFGHGSCFSFALPLPLDKQNSAEVEQAAHLTRTSLSANVLLVEDIPLNQKVAKHILEKFGCTVTVASSGQEALNFISLHRYDIIFMDVQMPEMDGHQTTRRIREIEQTLQQSPRLIIAMTASALSEDRKACMESGMNDFISKPLQPKLLETLLHKHMG
jgi:CheY-like chemotaxis protein